MDSQTLKNLMAAYQAAPSKELAKVIVLAVCELGEDHDLSVYLNELQPPLASQEAELLIKQLSQRSELERFKELLTAGKSNADSPEQQLILAKCELKLNNKSAAKALYIDTIKQQPNLESRELNSLFEVDPKTQLQDRPEDKKPYLRVVEKTTIDSIANLEDYQEKTTTFKDVVGLEDIKKQVHKRIILPFQKPSIFQRFKKKVGGGVLLYGPPGCGKTLIARATAGECNARFFNIEISDVLDMYIGESEQKLHAIFENARDQTPSVLFFDEIEALANKREYSRDSSSSKLVSQFLAELDGFAQDNHGVLILASTNVPWSIDPAFLRPGRFDRMFFVAPPDKAAREAILKQHLNGRPVANDINLVKLAEKTTGYSGADLANIVEMASDEAIDESIESEQDKDISAEHMLAALKQSRPTTTEWLTTARNYARYANDGGRYDDVLDFLRKHGKS